jgi:hypothetical protein
MKKVPAEASGKHVRLSSPCKEVSSEAEEHPLMEDSTQKHSEDVTGNTILCDSDL